MTPTTPKTTNPPSPGGMSKGKKIAIGLGFVFVMLIAGALGFAYRLIHSHHGDGTAIGVTENKSIAETLADITNVVKDPRAGFPNKDRVTILCMGIDDNWTDSDQVYSSQARTDTLFLLTLDLENKKATMLSIPRDTYAHIAGMHWNFKVNAAYQTGGPQRAIATVDELLGVHADHYMVLNIDSTKKVVDAVGGVDLMVEHEMHYHDKWGHLNIDLMPGEQHLDGNGAVGFARYRHPDEGKKGSPEDGDDRRMYRQHVLMRALIDKAKSFSTFSQASTLMDTAMQTIRTDMTRAQLLDLASLYHGIQPDDLKTASLPGEDFRGPKGEWFFRIYPEQSKAYVHWLVRGNEEAARPLINVVVKNGTGVSGLANRAVEELRASGFTLIRNGGNAKPAVKLASDETEITSATSGGVTKPAPSPTKPAITDLLDTGVPDSDAMAAIANILGVNQATQLRKPVKPNHLGWTPPAEIVVTLGQDYADMAQTSPAPSTNPSSDTEAPSDKVTSPDVSSQPDVTTTGN